MSTVDDLLIRRHAALAPSSINVEARTIEVIFSTGAETTQYDFTRGRYLETLSIDPQHIRWDRLNGGAPLLRNHGIKSGMRVPPDLADVLGVVEPGTARVESGRAVARVRFSKRPDVEPVWRDVQDGIIRNVSVGYRVHKYQKTGGEDGQPLRLRAIDWEPYEISAVPMGADDGAKVRAADKESTMEPTTTDTPTPPAPDPERARVQHILTITRSAEPSLGPVLARTLADELIANGTAAEVASHRILEELVRWQDRIGGPRGGGVGVGDVMGGPGGADDFRAAAVDGLLLRAGIQLPKPHAAARDMSGSIHEIARTCLSRAGIRHGGLSVDSLLQRVMTTSDFPLILVDALHKSIRRGYEDEPASHRAWVRTQPVRDFRDQHRPILGSAPSLEKVLEAGEYTFGPMDEDSTSYRVEKFGRIVWLSWEALINDDLSAFLRIQPALGQAARRREADNVYGLFALNAGAGPTMQDSVALFHDDHGNLGTAGPFDADLLDAARTLLRKQTALGGGHLALAPRTLLVPADLEGAAERLLAASSRQITGSADDVVTPWIGRLDLVVEPRLAADAVYLIASSAQIDTLELGLLMGNEDGPTIETERTFVVDSQRWKVRHVFGAKFLDWRGIVKQPVAES